MNNAGSRNAIYVSSLWIPAFAGITDLIQSKCDSPGRVRGKAGQEWSLGKLRIHQITRRCTRTTPRPPTAPRGTATRTGNPRPPPPRVPLVPVHYGDGVSDVVPLFLGVADRLQQRASGGDHIPRPSPPPHPCRKLAFHRRAGPVFLRVPPVIEAPDRQLLTHTGQHHYVRYYGNPSVRDPPTYPIPSASSFRTNCEATNRAPRGWSVSFFESK